MKILFLLPVYNDEKSVIKLINKIKLNYLKKKIDLEFLLINDNSNDDLNKLKKLNNVTLLDLSINVGNQKCIYYGISHIYHKNILFNYLVVMDSDGEDDPIYLDHLLNNAIKNNNKKIIFASRETRNESLLFRILYFFYKFIFNILTGKKINFGNYSCTPYEIFKNLINVPNIDKHFASAILKSKILYESVPCKKGNRYFGSSNMNYISFILHAMKSLSVFFEEILTRFLIISFLGFLISLLAIIFVIINKFISPVVLLGWSSNIVLGLSIINIIFIYIFFSCLLHLINKATFVDNNVNFSLNKNRITKKKKNI